MLRKLKALFDAPEPMASEHDLQLAAAALLIELGKADYQRDEREQQAIFAAVRNCYRELDEATVAELIRDAEAASDRATSLYEFTRIINERCGEEEKFQLVRELWRVAYADGAIDKYEDHLIRRIAELIYLPHALYIRAKLEVAS